MSKYDLLLQMYPQLSEVKELPSGVDVRLKSGFRFYAYNFERGGALRFISNIFLTRYIVKGDFGLDRNGEPKYIDAIQAILAGAEIIDKHLIINYLTGVAYEKKDGEYYILTPSDVSVMSDEEILVKDYVEVVKTYNNIKEEKLKTPHRAPKFRDSGSQSGAGLTGIRRRKSNRCSVKPTGLKRVPVRKRR